jgi:hypothetical protein
VIGVRTDRDVQILSGVAVGEVVVTSGLQQLRNGAPVEVDTGGVAPPVTAPSRPEGYE